MITAENVVVRVGARQSAAFNAVLRAGITALVAVGRSAKASEWQVAPKLAKVAASQPDATLGLLRALDALSGLGYRRKKRSAASGMQHLLRWLPIRVQFPMLLRACVGRVEYWMVKKWIGHNRCWPGLVRFPKVK